MANVGKAIDEEFNLEKCEECDRGPLDDTRNEFGNRIALSGIYAGGSGIAWTVPLGLDAVSWSTDGLARAFKKAGKSKWAEELDDFSDKTDAAKYIEKEIDVMFEAVEWEEINGDWYCYECKDNIQ